MLYSKVCHEAAEGVIYVHGALEGAQCHLTQPNSNLIRWLSDGDTLGPPSITFRKSVSSGRLLLWATWRHGGRGKSCIAAIWLRHYCSVEINERALKSPGLPPTNCRRSGHFTVPYIVLSVMRDDWPIRIYFLRRSEYIRGLS